MKKIYRRNLEKSELVYGGMSFGNVHFEDEDEMLFPKIGGEIYLFNSEKQELFICKMHSKQRRVDKKAFWKGTNAKVGDELGIAIIDEIVIYGPYKKTLEELSYRESVKIVEKDLCVKVSERETTYVAVSDYIGIYGSLVYQKLVQTRLNENNKFKKELERVDSCINNMKMNWECPV